MNVAIVRRESEEIRDLTFSVKIDLICAGVAFIGITFLANEELERRDNTKPDLSKIYVGAALILIGALGYTINKIFHSCFQRNRRICCEIVV